MTQIKWVWQNLGRYRKIFVIGLVLTLITSSIVIVNPKLSQILVDEVLTNQRTEWLLPLLGIMMAVQLTRLGLRYLMNYCMERSSQLMVFQLRYDLYKNLQRQDSKFYDAYRTGDLMTRLTGDTDMIRHFTAAIFYQLVDSVTIFAAALILLFTIDWLFTLCMLAVAPFIFFTTVLFSKKVRPMYVSLRDKLSNLNTCAQENIAGNRVVKAFAREDFEQERFDEKNQEFKDANQNAALTWLRYWPYIEFFAQSLTVITILVGGAFVINGRLTLGEVFAFSSLTWAIAGPMRNLGPLLNDTQRFLASASKVMEVYYAQPDIVDCASPYSPKQHCKGDITFEDVTFSYGRNLVLENISFSVKSGQTLAIMGPTGCGKTTIANLLARFYDVQKGSVKLDGVDVREWAVADLRHNIGMAMQDVFLFSDTVDGNIAYGNLTITEEESIEFARKADADGFIRKLENGYDTIIGERGVGLSGGQKQRIALARALAVKPPVLILDDTTSAVDLETEKYIQQQLQGLSYPCTKIVIAQRISSVKDADYILVVKDHRIVEQGTHQELLKRGGYYYDTFILQNGEVNADSIKADLRLSNG